MDPENFLNTVFAVIKVPENFYYKSAWLLCLNEINTLPLRVVLKLGWRLINSGEVGIR